MSALRQDGFTLVELMVSLLIGLLIILGATQLFLISRQSFERVEDFGIRQGALNFSVDVLSRDVRRAEHIRWDGNALELVFPGLIEPGFCDDVEIEKRIYSLKRTTASGSDWSLTVETICAGETPASSRAAPLVSGFVEDGFDADDLGSGLWELTLGLAPIGEDPDPEEITFLVMNRMRALGAGRGTEEAKPGYDSEGNKLYPNACYHGGDYDPDKPGCRI